MSFRIEDLLTPDEVTRIREVLTRTNFVDGRLTAGEGVRDVKRNLQAADRNPQLDACGELVTSALLNAEAFTLRALPCRMLPVMFNRYDAGMEYGTHADNAILGGGDIPPLRADVSVTVFLSDPDEYQGGGLVIHSDRETASLRPAAGTAIVYDSTTLHRVEPVTGGTRLAAITWAQSLVRDPARREMLLEMTELVRWTLRVAPGSPQAIKIVRVRANLMRLWAEP